MNKTPWTERKFNFDFSAGLFPSILERLIGTPVRVEKMIEQFPSSILTKQVNGKWSIQQHIGHLIDLEELHEGRILDFKAGLKTLRAADMNNKKTNEANHNQKQIKKLLEELRLARITFVQNLQELTDEELVLTSIHPRLQKPMRLVDMAYFVAEHDDQHLACMREIANKFSL